MQLYTIGQAAEQLGVPVHRIRYAVDSRGIKHASTAGRYRLFGLSQMRQIKAALAETERNDDDEAGREVHEDGPPRDAEGHQGGEAGATGGGAGATEEVALPMDDQDEPAAVAPSSFLDGLW